MTLDKQFHGDREGTSQGEMLTAGTRIKATGTYVAIERVITTPNTQWLKRPERQAVSWTHENVGGEK